MENCFLCFSSAFWLLPPAGVMTSRKPLAVSLLTGRRIAARHQRRQPPTRMQKGFLGFCLKISVLRVEALIPRSPLSRNCRGVKESLSLRDSDSFELRRILFRITKDTLPQFESPTSRNPEPELGVFCHFATYFATRETPMNRGFVAKVATVAIKNKHFSCARVRVRNKRKNNYPFLFCCLNNLLYLCRQNKNGYCKGS